MLDQVFYIPTTAHYYNKPLRRFIFMESYMRDSGFGRKRNNDAKNN